MAPLGNMKFTKQNMEFLELLANYGVDAITTDIWWNHVEYVKGTYDWRGAKAWLRALKKAGLRWTPILSFHTCGHNVNDDHKIGLPKYVQREFTFFRNDEGRVLRDYVSFWNTDVYKRYEAFIQSFYDTFVDDFEHISKVYISMGPAGELRYPSYSSLLGWKYPEPGSLTCYGKDARRSFRKYIEHKYISLRALNIEWDTHYTEWDKINPPEDGEAFFTQYQYTSVYGRDVLDWYEGQLHRHFIQMATICRRIFKQTVRLGVKLSGVHWKYHSGRLAEKAAGYVDETYVALIRQIHQFDFDLTITCLEMQNNKESGIDCILDSIRIACDMYDVDMYGENALPVYSEHNDVEWENIARNINKLNIKAFTFLRWDVVFNNNNILQKMNQIIF